MIAMRALGASGALAQSGHTTVAGPAGEACIDADGVMMMTTDE